jgi:hypothetical protein
MRRSVKKTLVRLWGYLLILVIGYGWIGNKLGPGIIALLSTAVVLYCLFQAPMWCGAETRAGEFCRNNAYGILMGCHLKQHKWQKMKMAVRRQSWARLWRSLLRSVGGQAATVSALAGSMSAVVAVLALTFKK